MDNELEQTKPVNEDIEIYKGASMLTVSDEEQKKLMSPFDEKFIEIRPDGLIYLPQTFWRERLNQSFGIGQWCIIPKRQTKDPVRNKLYLEGVLIIRGNYVATAIGEAEYHETNQMQSWASVWESAKSDCITRCCKDLGIANLLWQPQFTETWKGKNAIKVWREKTGKKKDGGLGSFQWRKKDAPKFYDEKGIEVKRQEPDKENIPVNEYLLQWQDSILQCQKRDELINLYNGNKATIDADPKIKEMFKKQQAKINPIAGKK